MNWNFFWKAVGQTILFIGGTTGFLGILFLITWLLPGYALIVLLGLALFGFLTMVNYQHFKRMEEINKWNNRE